MLASHFPKKFFSLICSFFSIFLNFSFQVFLTSACELWHGVKQHEQYWNFFEPRQCKRLDSIFFLLSSQDKETLFQFFIPNNLFFHMFSVDVVAMVDESFWTPIHIYSHWNLHNCLIFSCYQQIVLSKKGAVFSEAACYARNHRWATLRQFISQQAYESSLWE